MWLASGLSGVRFCSRRRVISVSIGEGQIAFTRTPASANSSAAVFVIPITACLLAPYGTMPGMPLSPATEAVFTIAPPPRSIIPGTTYFIPSQTPLRLTAITRSKSSSGYSVSGATPPSMPALLKKTSIAPNCSVARST